MEKLKIYCDGAKFYGGQLDRIEQGFLALGHELVNNCEEADLIYSNNPSETRSIIVDGIRLGATNAKVVFNILDVPFHIWDSFKKNDLGKWSNELSYADGITTISEFVKESVQYTFAKDSTVIYQPIKPVRKISTEKRFKYLFVGRKYDPNKNVVHGVGALQMLGIPESEVGMIGADNVGWGTYLGAVSDEELNSLYNGADFVFCLGYVEGISLPVVESMAAGAIPIVIRELTTREEWLPSVKFPEYLQVSADRTSVAKFIAQFLQDNNKMEQMKHRLFHYYKDELEVKFTPIAVASKILEVYYATKSK